MPMPKRCAECGTIVADDAPYCEACGGRSWRPPEVRRINPVFALAAIVIVAVALFAWFYLRR
jgi:uncharacterized OB-fold protein